MALRSWLRPAATALVVVLAAALMWVGYRRLAAERSEPPVGPFGLLTAGRSANAAPGPVAVPPPPGQPAAATAAPAVAPAEPAPTLTIHVAGAVARPGVYALPEGARVADAVKAAGGALPDGLPHALNLASPLADGEKVYVPAAAELAEGAAAPPAALGADHAPVPAGTGGGSVRKSKINLNTAGAEELEAIPGIGPALAERILEHRSKARFRQVEDLLNVPGIGPKKLEQIRGHVTV